MAEVYELVNPSDAVCFETDDEEALCVGALLLGGGWYGLTCGERQVLGFAMFGQPAEEAAQRVTQFLDRPDGRTRVAAALRTAIYCKAEERRALVKAFAAVPEDARRAALATFNDEKRSSMNNIGKAAEALAARLEAAGG